MGERSAGAPGARDTAWGRRDVRSLAARALERLRARAEAWTPRGRGRLPKRERLLGVLGEAWGTEARAEALFARFRDAPPGIVLPGWRDPAATASAVAEGWPEGVGRTVGRADRAVEGRFDLLGHRELSFGDPVDWRLDPVSGRRAPDWHWSRIDPLEADAVGDHKVVWELNRHGHFVLLARAWHLTGMPRYGHRFRRDLEGWMAANPPGRGINWASSLEVALRAVAWTWALQLFRDHEALDAGLFARTLAFLRRHGEHVERHLSTRFSPNTHLTGEALGLVYLGSAFPGLDGGRGWADLGRRILTRELERQVRADGLHFEAATWYHRYTVDFVLHLRLLDEAGARPSAADDRLAAMVDGLVHLARPEGSTPLVGDDDGGRLLALDERPPDDFRSTVATAAVLLERDDWAHAAAPPSQEIAWLLGPEALRRFDRLEPRPPRPISRAFRQSGFYSMRESWDASAGRILIRCGPHGALRGGHAHADALAVDVAWGGVAFLADPGTYTYLPEHGRDAFRSTGAHSTVTVDGAPSAEPGGPFAWRSVPRSRSEAWHEHPRFDAFRGVHDGFRRLNPPADHRRDILLLKGDYGVLCDRVTVPEGADGSTRPPEDGTATRGADARHLPRKGAVAHLRFGPGIEVELEGPRLRARHPPTGGRLTLHVSGAEAPPVLEEGWSSPVYGRRQRVPYARVRLGAGAELLTLLLPAGVASADVEEVEASGGRQLRVRAGEWEDALGLSRGALLEGPDMTSDFRWAWLRRDAGSGRPLEAVLVEGRRFVASDFELEAEAEAQWVRVTWPGGRPRVESEGGGPRPRVRTRTVRGPAVTRDVEA